MRGGTRSLPCSAAAGARARRPERLSAGCLAASAPIRDRLRRAPGRRGAPRLGCVLLLLAAGCARNLRSESAGEEGEASWYGPGLYGRKTASGEVLRPGTLTAAHRTLPFGSCVRVTNLENGRVVEVRVNDRGPYAAGRILDVSETAARALGMHGRGVTRVRLDRCSGNAAVEQPAPQGPVARAWIQEASEGL